MFSRTDIPRKESEEVGEHILTKAVKAGRRTYFFDVRATRGNDYYLTITESRKTTVADGSVVFDRHKIFLYKEDFARFDRTLREVLDFIAACQRGTKPPQGRKRKVPFRNEKMSYCEIRHFFVRRVRTTGASGYEHAYPRFYFGIRFPVERRHRRAMPPSRTADSIRPGLASFRRRRRRAERPACVVKRDKP